MKNKRILVDCDGVLVRWLEGFEKWLLEEHNIVLEPEQPGFHRVENRVPGFLSVDAVKFVFEFNKSDYIAKLEPFRDAQKYVQKLHQEGFTFHCITAIEDSKEIYDRRWLNLQTLFGGAVDQLTLVDNLSNKIHHLTKYRDTGRYWIEDSIENALDGHELGLETILITHDHSLNFKHDDIHVVDSWEKIYEIITH